MPITSNTRSPPALMLWLPRAAALVTSIDATASAIVGNNPRVGPSTSVSIMT
ncbi:MAG: hypothetical protein V3R71_06095 [Gemmatimonadales bacterium]